MAPARSPSDNGHSRRTVLQTSVAALSAAAVGSLAGCLGETAPSSDGDGGATTKTYDVDSRLAAVPAGLRRVQYVHVGDVLADPAVRALVDAQFQQQTGSHDDGPTSFEEARKQFDEQSPVALSGLHEVVSYNLQPKPDEDYSYDNGILLWTDWATADVVSGFEQLYGRELTESSYRNTPVYEPTDSEDHHYPFRQVLGALGDGQYVFGSRRGVEAAIDVAAGHADALSGQLRAAFEETRGPVQFAMAVPQEQFAKQAESDDSHSPSYLNPAVLQHVSHAHGSIYAEDDRRIASLTLVAEDAGTATELRKMVDGALATARQNTADDESVHAIVEDARSSQDGKRVTVSVAATVDELESAAGHLASQSTASASGSASGSSTATPQPPSVEYVGASGTVSEGAVESLSLTVELQEEAAPVDLTEASVMLHHLHGEDASHYRLVHEGATGGDADGTFTTDVTTLEKPGTTATLRIDLGADSGLGVTPVGDAASPGDGLAALTRLEDRRGAAAKFEIPESLSGKTVELPVPRNAS